jgi:hypothetical protein
MGLDRQEVLRRIRSQTKPYRVNMTGVGGRPIDQLEKSLKAMGDEPVRRLDANTIKYDGHTWKSDAGGNVEFIDGLAAFRSEGRTSQYDRNFDKINWKKK